MVCRKSVAAMIAAGEQAAFVQAVLDLKNIAPSIIPQAQAAGALGRYDDYVWLHQAAFSLIHLGPAFGPWHREILRQFELDLQAVSGNPDMYIPYWDWPTARQSGDPGWPFVNDLMGGFGTGADHAVVTGPFAGSTGDWAINVRDFGDTHTVLRRVPSTNPASLSLPNTATTNESLAAQPYDSSPYNDNNFPSDPQLVASFRKSLEFLLHNGPHNWVGNDDPVRLDMMRGASPNDPIFFLHHSQVDRMWSVWQDKHPTLDHFTPLSGASSGHNLNQVIDVLDAAYFNFPVLDTNASQIDLHSTGVWYDSDIPDVTLATPSVHFADIPAGMTTWFPVQFTVEGCRAMHFEITGVGGSGFFIPAGNAIVNVPATDDPSPRTVDVFVECRAPSDGSPVGPGSVQIDAYVVDDDGYLSDTVGANHVFDTFMATLSADIVSRPTSAVAFVSDRSGSMSGDAGGGLTKFQLLEEALEVSTDLLRPSDSAALVFFDSAVMTPMPMSAISAGGVASALADPSIQPSFGSTAIGAGLIAGAAELDSYVAPPGVTDPNLAILCLTDGNENVDPLVNTTTVGAAIAANSDDVYAIGLGTEDNVSASTLGAISQYMLVTGDRTADQRRFLVTKYFVQILADVKKASIIVDPDGRLYDGVVHDIPFDVTEADVEAEIIVLCPGARYLQMQLVTPGGDVMAPAAPGPNASFEVNRLDVIVRLVLPAVPSSPATSHAGRWRLRLGLADERVHAARKAAFALRQDGRVPSIEYSAIVQSRSNLTFEAGRTFPHIRPGESMPLVASLQQYRVPVTTARVIAQVTGPQGEKGRHELKREGDRFVASVPTRSRGVYTCRLMANGRTLGGYRFTRETTRTFAVGAPGTQPADDGKRPDPNRDVWLCLLRDRGIRKILKSRGVDVKKLRKCLKGSSNPTVERARPKAVTADAAVHPDVDPLTVKPAKPVQRPELDPDLFDAPMFMPALARNEKGEVVFATTGEPVPERGDPDIGVGRVHGVSEDAARRLHEAGYKTAGDLLERPQKLRGILDVSKKEIKALLHAARVGRVQDDCE